MPSANVDLVRSIYAAWERGDFNSAAWADPEIEYLPGGLEAPRRGAKGMAASWRDFLDSWEKLHAKATEYRELDDGRVLVIAEFGGRGKSSGLDIGHVRATGASLFEIRDGKVTSLTLYPDHQAALADLGLAPE